MAKTYYDQDADLSLIQSKKVGIIGYGSQGHAHALNASDSGVQVRVGLRPESKSVEKAQRAGLTVATVPEVAEWADWIVMLAPDTAQPKIYKDQIEPHLQPGDTLMFSHGFNIRYKAVSPPEQVNVSMIAPKSPGHRLRETFEENQGVPGLVAVHQDATGTALAEALSYGKAIGCTRAGVIETTFAEETETDLFGEQAVLCGGVTALIGAGFETLVEAGYQPEVAYFECLHELKLIVDLIYQGGLGYMRYSISDTAEYGDYTAGPKVIDEHVRARMKELLQDIQDGSFANQWIHECEEGQPSFQSLRGRNRELSIEKVGRELRGRMPFLNAVEVPE